VRRHWKQHNWTGQLDEEMGGAASLTIKRSKLIPMMVQFDGPDSLQGLGRRPQTTIAPQHVAVNNSQVRAAAFDFANAPNSSPKFSDGCGEFAYQTALGRASASENWPTRSNYRGPDERISVGRKKG